MKNNIKSFPIKFVPKEGIKIKMKIPEPHGTVKKSNTLKDTKMSLIAKLTPDFLPQSLNHKIIELNKKEKLIKKTRENYAIMSPDIIQKYNSLFLYLNILFYLQFLKKERIKQFINIVENGKEINKR